MKLFGIGSNIMSLGGIAIAIGAMVDASIVMIENAHKSIHRQEEEKGSPLDEGERIKTIITSSQLVGRPIFFALALVVVSFLPIFALSGQEGLLFNPLAFTKTFAMTAGAILSVTLVPVLMIYFVRGKIIPETKIHSIVFLFGCIIHFGLWVKTQISCHSACHWCTCIYPASLPETKWELCQCSMSKQSCICPLHLMVSR